MSNIDALKVRPAIPADEKWLNDLMDKNWGGLPLVIRGKKYYPAKLNGIIAENGNDVAGFLFYEIQNQDCEIIVLEVFDKFKGTGTLLLDELKNIAKSQCSRVYLMTTNDNIDALRFYQKRGFHICGIHIDSVKISRKIKPTIGILGDYDIPVRDEIDLELIL